MGTRAIGMALGMDAAAGSALRVSRSRERDEVCRSYRLDVIATTVADVVQSAGGWLYDRVAAGWEVNVLLSDASYERALQILGVQVADLTTGLTNGAIGKSLAVSADAFASNPCVREALHAALGHSLIEVTVWGDGWPVQVGRATAPVQHRLSAAARTFKAHALTAVGATGSGAAVAEMFRSDLGRFMPVESDLVPVEIRTRG